MNPGWRGRLLPIFAFAFPKKSRAPQGTALEKAWWVCNLHIAPLQVALLMGGRRQIFRSSGSDHKLIIHAGEVKGEDEFKG